MTREEAAAALEAIADEIRAHTSCGQEPCKTCTNFVPGDGDPQADIVIVGEAPGAQEDKTGKPFVGAAGRNLSALLERAGLQREEVFITNVVKARPPKNRDPKKPEVEHHLPWLLAQLEIIQPKLVVPLGRHALAHFAPAAKISEMHGTLVETDTRRLFPWYHPAAALHNQSLRETLLEDADKLRETLAALA